MHEYVPKWKCSKCGTYNISEEETRDFCNECNEECGLEECSKYYREWLHQKRLLLFMKEPENE
tara:strand:- start:333 stop:521 length:189 start_codon:yes stop_codon:yes gene_type:complete